MCYFYKVQKYAYCLALTGSHVECQQVARQFGCFTVLMYN